jgi:hypothetical protein
MLHTSTEKTLEIKDESGLFGSFLFCVYGDAAHFKSAYQMSGSSKYVHHIDEDDFRIVEAYQIEMGVGVTVIRNKQSMGL